MTTPMHISTYSTCISLGLPIDVQYFLQANCCSDKEHCCPSDYKCTSTGDCTKGADVIKAATKTEARVIAQSSENDVNVLCPDHKSACAAGQTCCPIGGGQWGCCPFDEAVCCDPTYCCEKGYTCRDKKCYKATNGKMPL